jgi:hypothetical protein
VEGEQSLVLADTSGSVATVVSTGRDRRVQEGEGELYLEGGEPSSEGSVVDPKPSRVILDPQSRALRLEAEGAKIEVVLA